MEEFFKRAATTRAFEVIVAEGGPSLNVCMNNILVAYWYN